MRKRKTKATTARAPTGAAAPRGPGRSGMAMILALALLTVMASLAVAFSLSAASSLRQADNLQKIDSAQCQAESGLAFHSYLLRHLTVPTGVTGSDLVLAVATGLRGRLDGTATLDGLSIVNDPNTILIPNIATSDTAGFSAVLSLTEDAGDALQLVVTGHSGLVTRRVSAQFQLRSIACSIFGDYGIASRGKVAMSGNARVSGANDATEANVLSATYSDDEAIAMSGNCEIAGDLSISNPDGYASLSGNVSIGGVSASSEEIDSHIRTSVGQVEFPEVDPTVFERFATNTVDGSTATSGNVTFDNIRILAGTNKTFSGNITLTGVIFIEVPNNIHFSGNVTITGVIVTQDAGDNNHDDNTIKFTGNTTARGVDQLPELPQYAGLRQLPGAFLLAPGFGAEFTGNFGTVSGWMAADQFKFTGNAGGTVKGGVINYGDTEFELTGNSNLTIDRSGAPPVPSGFHGPTTATLALQPGTYCEN